jgi:hypothetical protein
MMSSGPQNVESASSVDVPAVFLVFRKINRCAWETIMLAVHPSKLDLISPRQGGRIVLAGEIIPGKP